MKQEENITDTTAVTQKKKNVPMAATIALLSACFLWAASFIASKVALESIPPMTVVMLRMIVSSACFLVYLLYKKSKIVYHGHSWLGKMFLLSLFGTGLHYGIQTLGINYTTASNASLYTVTGPISITIIAALFLGEKVTLKKAGGIFCALVGVLVVMGIDTLKDFQLEGRVLGDLLVFLSIFMWGIFTVMGKDVMRKTSALHLTAIVTFMGTIYMLPVGWIEMNHKGISLSSITVGAWGAVAFLGITCSFLATLLYFYALEKMESQKVGVYLYTIPPMNYVIAALFLGESIGLNLLLGSAIVFAGVYLTEKG
ncbi:MAG: DMT family transporter [bacterium]|nr:DMT family transporter [bacterium]